MAPGYCVLLTDDPTVTWLSDLATGRRRAARPARVWREALSREACRTEVSAARDWLWLWGC